MVKCIFEAVQSLNRELEMTAMEYTERKMIIISETYQENMTHAWTSYDVKCMYLIIFVVRYV